MTRYWNGILLLFVSLNFLGCSAFDKYDPNHTRRMPLMDAKPELPKLELPSLNGEKKIRFGRPVAMAVIWKDTVYSSLQGGATRGFGGRIYFYDAQGKPIRVDGDLHIYGFDDSSETFDKSKPDRKLTYRRSELQGHFSETDLGPSYSIWVPWDAVGGYRKTVSLLPIFKPVDGGICQGGMDLVVLPGLPTEEDLENRELERMADEIRRGEFPVNGRVSSNQRTISTHGDMTFAAQHELAGKFGQTQSADGGAAYPAQQVNHEQAVAADSGFRTTTISVPRDMANRMAQLPPQHANGAAQRGPGQGPAAQPGQSGQASSQLPPNVNPYYMQQVQDQLTTAPNAEVPGSLMQQAMQAGGPAVNVTTPASPAGADLRSRLDRRYNTDSSKVFGVPGSFHR